MIATVASTPHLRRIGLALTIVSLAAIAFATLLPEAAPAHGSVLCLACGPGGGVNAILNVLLFVPLGIGLALGGVPGKRAALAMCVLSSLIESAQFFVIAGRYAAIGDVLTNSAGGALGFVIGRYLFAMLRPPPRMAMLLTAVWCSLWLGIQTISAFGFSPSLPRSQYYGEIAPRLGNFDPFDGQVASARIGGVEMPNGPLPDTRRVREVLIGGASVMATVTPSAGTSGIAPILRVADAEEREIVLLGQRGEDAVFGLRTGAAILRLRAPLFAFPGVFVAQRNDSQTGGENTLSAEYSPRDGRVTMEAGTIVRRIQLRAALGWTLFMPFEWFIEGSRGELVLCGIWIACLLLPIGYWGRSTSAFRPRANAGASMILRPAIPLIIVFVGLAVLPRVFGLPISPPMDWLAASVGLVVGAALARRPQGYRAPIAAPAVLTGAASVAET